MEKEILTQKQMIAAALKRGEIITPMTAYVDYGCLNLSARIGELRMDGMKIHKEWLKVPSGKRVMSYSLI